MLLYEDIKSEIRALFDSFPLKDSVATLALHLSGKIFVLSLADATCYNTPAIIPPSLFFFFIWYKYVIIVTNKKI